MDNKLVEEVHGVDFRELSWHVQSFDIQRRCIVAVVGIVFSCLENFPFESHKKIPVLTGGGLSLEDELFSVDDASPALTCGGKDLFSPDIVEFWSKEKQSVPGC